MPLKRASYSIIAGVLTPITLVLMSGGMPTNFVDSSNPVRAIVLGTDFLFALGIALLRPISPPIYGAALAVTCFAVPFAIGAIGGWGNLGVLVALFAAAWGLMIGTGVAVAGLLLRLLKPRAWAAPAVIAVAVATAVATSAWRSAKTYEQSFAILDRVQEIRRAEFAYASQREDHAFTCNGPDLPGLKNIEWTANLALGRQEKYQARLEGHWLVLTCPPSAHPQWVDILTDSATGQVVRVTR